MKTKCYENGKILVPKGPNMFWKAFRVEKYTSNTGQNIKYDVLCYSKIRTEAIDNKVIQMDQDIMKKMTRVATKKEIKDLKL